ncbi:DNA-binding transcriptional LysR family regulator [Aminobacter lissarensis]|nr:DNA-binding transcriptional LysR family regulator [Aminobacter lissarensis]
MDVALALQGEGVAMVVPTFFQDELTSGRLIRPFEHVVRDGRSYSLIYPKARSKSKKVRIFRDWVIGEANAIHRSSRA